MHQNLFQNRDYSQWEECAPFREHILLIESSPYEKEGKLINFGFASLIFVLSHLKKMDNRPHTTITLSA